MILIFFSLGHHWNILDFATLVPDVVKLTWNLTMRGAIVRFEWHMLIWV